MALSVANAVSSSHAVEAVASGSALLAGNSNGASSNTFLDSLEAVLGIRGVAAGDTGAGDPQTLLMAANVAKSKNKVTSDAASAALLAAQPSAIQQQNAQQTVLQAGPQATPLQSATQQASIRALQNTAAGIDLPALRAALATSSSRGIPAMQAAGSQQGAASTANDVTAVPAAGATNAGTSAGKITTDLTDQSASNRADGSSNAAGLRIAQTKLAAALAKVAQAPILKDGTADGSEVPNAKLGHDAQTQSQNSATAADQLAQIATRIAATAGATSTPDTAATAAKAAAVAEVTTRPASSTAAPSIAKIESAAMTNSAQAALHVAAPQERTDAQALPIQFDNSTVKPSGGKSEPQADTGSKDQDASNGAPASNNASDTAQPTADSQQQQPAQTLSSTPTAAAGTSTAANLAATLNNTGTSQQTPAQIAANIHVTPQTQQPAPDQATFAALGVAIAAKSRDGEHQFDIKMDPAELGKVDVRISVDASGTAQAHLSVQHQQTLELLQNDKATLERNLRDAGLNLANNGLNFSLKGEQQSSTPTFNARNRALSVSAAQSIDSISTTSSTSIAPGGSRLDIRV